MLCVIAGGVGAAKFLAGLDQVVDPSSITALVNVADDFMLHGLRISPDLDTVTYTLARAVNPETGWGLVGETWTAMTSLERYGGMTWFRLGDQDLATHLYRTQRFDEGATLAEITAEITAAWNIGVRVVPVSNDAVATVVTLADTGEEVDFQTYFVRQHHDVAVSGCSVRRRRRARPAPGVLDAIGTADDGDRGAVEPVGLDRPGAGRTRRPGCVAGPPGSVCGCVAHRRRRRAQGPSRPNVARAGPRGQRGRAWPACTPRFAPPSCSTRSTPHWPPPCRTQGCGPSWRPRSCPPPNGRRRWPEPCWRHSDDRPLHPSLCPGGCAPAAR